MLPPGMEQEQASPASKFYGFADLHQIVMDGRNWSANPGTKEPIGDTIFQKWRYGIDAKGLFWTAAKEYQAGPLRLSCLVDRPQPGLGGRHHLHPDSGSVYVFGADYRQVVAQDRGLSFRPNVGDAGGPKSAGHGAQRP